jgi:hypothetical protein
MTTTASPSSASRLMSSWISTIAPTSPHTSETAIGLQRSPDQQSQGWSFGAGCGNQTSPAQPASCPLSSVRTIASRSQILPRAVFTR